MAKQNSFSRKIANLTKTRLINYLDINTSFIEIDKKIINVRLFYAMCTLNFKIYPSFISLEQSIRFSIVYHLKASNIGYFLLKYDKSSMVKPIVDV